MTIVTTKNIEKIAEELSTLTVIEAAQLSKLLEEKWGVSPTTVQLAAPNTQAMLEPNDALEKTEFDVTLLSVGDKKIEVIKVVRSITSLGLKEAKDLVDSAPSTLRQGVAKLEADDIKTKLEAVGAKVEIK